MADKKGGRSISDADTNKMSAIDKVELKYAYKILSNKNSSKAAIRDARAVINDLNKSYPNLMFKSGGMLKKPNNKGLSKLPKSVRNNMGFMQKGGMIGAADMSAKKTSAPKKKKMPQYYMGGGMIKKGKKYAYGGRVAKYKG